jgi:hypothetical protein
MMGTSLGFGLVLVLLDVGARVEEEAPAGGGFGFGEEGLVERMITEEELVGVGAELPVGVGVSVKKNGREAVEETVVADEAVLSSVKSALDWNSRC